MLDAYISDRISEAYDYMQNDREKALTIFDEILEIESENIEAINGKGSTLMKLNRFDEAEKCFNLSLSICVNSSALLNKGIIYKQKKEFDKAIFYFDKTLEVNPNLKEIILILKMEINKNMDEIDIRNYNDKANELIQQGIKFKNENKLWNAHDSFKKALEKDNSCEKQVNKLLYDINKTLEKDFLYYDKELDINNKSDRLIIISTRALIEDNNPKKALTLINLALDLNKNDLYILNRKGGILFICSEYQKAIECFDKCLSKDKHYYYALFNKGIVLRTMNKLPEALNCFNELLKIPKIGDNAKNYHSEILENIKNQQTE